MLVLEKQEKYDGIQQFYAIVQLIGTRKQAENFAYRYLWSSINFIDSFNDIQIVCVVIVKS